MKKMKKGFTLIELLMVVLVILMLSALLFRVASLVGDRALRARAVADIQNMQNVLNEYFAVYGTYPPVAPFDPAYPHLSMWYIYENTNLQPPVLRHEIRNPPQGSTPISDFDIKYNYGLVSYLYEREQGVQYISYDRDTERDVAAKRRWAHYLRDVNVSRHDEKYVFDLPDSKQIYSNSVMSVTDPWGKDYRYDTRPPHISYRLWSAGPDKSDNTPDDISNATF